MKERKRTLTGVMAALLFMVSTGGITAYAAGWSDDSGDWQYRNNDDIPVTDQWKKSDDDWFYLNGQGLMERNRLLQVEDNYYYVDEDGKMVRNSWMRFEADGSDESAIRWYYFGPDGKAYHKNGDKFKKQINGSFYIFDEDGVMLTGFIDENGETLSDVDDPYTEALYFCGEDGAAYREQWKSYEYQDDKDLRSDMSERNYLDYEALWLYFDSEGRKVRSKDSDKLVERTIGGQSYGFDDNGVMMSWWSKTATGSNASEKFYSGYDGGKLLKSTWVWMYPSEEMNEDDYSNLEYSWWRTDDNGRVYRDRIREIGGMKYAFDDIGRLQTGFVLYDGDRKFVAQHDIDTWESEDFKNAIVYGIEKGDLYLFGPDEFNGGAMQSGYSISVELADGVYSFGFAGNGKAYGSRNKLARVKDCYYINGLKLEAHDDLKYGVVDAGGGKYRVVNTSGKIVKGNRKLVKDTEDGWYVIIGDEFKAYASATDKPRWYNGPEGEGYYRYDSDNKEYLELIAGKNTIPDDSELPTDAKLNFE